MWFEKLLYNDDELLNIFLTEEERRELANPPANSVESVQEPVERRFIQTYKFKTPGIVRRITGTYFKKSGVQDIEKVKKRLREMKREYRSKHARYSVDLERIGQRNRQVFQSHDKMIGIVTY